MVPVLAALPQPGGFPWFTAAAVLVVVAVGAFVARRALAEVARLSRLRTKLAVAPWPPAPSPRSPWRCSTSSPVARSGSSGSRPSVLRPAGCSSPLLLELGLGAVVVVLRDAWRLRR